jgi:ABC-type multidrug transport system ATPase subunit
MDIFYDFKGANPNPKVKEAEITKLLIDVGVDDKKNDLAGQLSGGNQRKLSAAIALCGGSKFVVFDEPTAGMDLSARRQLW